ncbi:hypothetical protein BD626DRAFT_480869 [Schizophyllum amplum]|uniref:Uncharacterized protein n=1 Tax=Schizophyllum amplum TaxID=97359 RepID=A0A550CTL5_9AGAR|nr:hypothetical protein BD626DRAFT_480869 [Auriculariopsis ampla]
MSSHTFLFSSFDNKRPLTARKLHIRRLWDVLHLCIQKHDIARTRRAWLVLARCKEIPWTAHWNIATLILSEGSVSGHNEDDLPAVDFLRTMMLQHPDSREDMLRELVLHFIAHDRCREALDELELYLPSFPYSDNPTLHVYAGLTRLYLAQPSSPGATFNKTGLRDAQSHFERALALDENNAAARVFLEKIPRLMDQDAMTVDHDSEDENDMRVDDDASATDSPSRKRMRT